jgi:signal transduction histidine kinase
MVRKKLDIDQSQSCYAAVTLLAFDFAYIEHFDHQKEILFLDWATNGFFALLDCSIAELQKNENGWRSLGHNEDILTINPHIQNLKNEIGSCAEYRIVTKKGEILWIRDYAQPVNDPNEPSKIKIFGAIKNLTDEKRILSELQSAQADFVYRASHELRTPLTTAILTADLLREGCNDEEASQYWEILGTELHRQKQLVDRLLTLGRLESGHIRYNYSIFDPTLTVNEAITSQQPQLLSKQIKTTLTITPDLAPIHADRDALLQIIINLLNNAIKFSPPESVIDLAVSNQEKDREGKNKTGVCIRISDKGIGIPPEDLPLLFSKFFRAKNAIEESIPGSGAGLYIVKSMLEELGGDIQVESKVNAGTTFKIWLPCD